MRNKPNGKGERAIYLKRFIQGSYFMKSTGIWLLPEHWNQKSQKVVKRLDAEDLNSKLDKIRSKEIRQNKITPKEQKTKHLFFVYAREVNDLNHSRQKYGYTSWYNKDKAIDAFCFFVTHMSGIETLYVEDVSVELFDKYIAYRLNVLKNTSREGINKTLVPLYDAVRYAAKNKLLSAKVATSICDNYILIKETKYKDEPRVEEKVRYLTMDQMKKFKEFTDGLPPCKRKEVADMFFFSYYTCGMRVSDVMTLEWDQVDLIKKVIRKTQFKTKSEKPIEVTINEEARKILLRWMEYDRNSRFVFDLLDKNIDLNNQRAVFMARNARDRMMNRVLGELSRELGFDHLSFHMARHTFAVVSLDRGVSVYMLSKLLGHSSITATEKTYAQFLKEKVDDEAKRILDISF